jgi:hypothetical protein
MDHEWVLLVALPAIAVFIALPALMAFHRRRATREASEIAIELTAFAQQVRRTGCCQPLDPILQQRARRLRIPELTSLQLALELPQPQPEVLADTAQRLSLRLKRRVAFERKMLARTASGRRRGAVAAAVAPVVLLSLRAANMEFSAAAIVFLLLIEGCASWMLWRLARVEI